MGIDQTGVVSQKAPIAGSVKVEYSTDGGSTFTNVGVGDGFQWAEEITKLDQTPDNGATPERLEGVSKQTVTVSGSLWEYDPEKIAALRGGIDTFTSIAGTTISGASQVVASGDWSFSTVFELEGQNSDGTAPTINSVTGSVDGALTEDVDFFVVKSQGGKWGISVIDTVDVTTEVQSLTVDYDYTPSVGVKRTTGGLSTQSTVWVRLTNKNPDTADANDAASGGISIGDAIWRVTQWDVYYGTVSTGPTVTFPSETGTETVVKFPLEILGKQDPSRSAGDQLYSEQKFIEAR